MYYNKNILTYDVYHMYSATRYYIKELTTIILLLFCCILNYFVQQVFIPFLLPLNIIVLVCLIVKNINVSILYIIICALLDEQLLGYHFCSLVTLYLFICFTIINCNKYSKTTLIVSLLLWSCINYNTQNIISLFGY